MLVQMFSIHGLVRGTEIELGKDADTGGQVRYVVELAQQLSKDKRIDRVDLVTRMIKDGAVDPSYATPIEELGPKARIVRIPCGDCSYKRKELLWPLLDEFTANVIRFNLDQDIEPDVVHGHYADGGLVARGLARHYHCPLVFTGHSLGKPKLEYLLQQGWTHQRANEILNIDYRIGAEQLVIDSADLVICSTTHERDTQYGEYHLPVTPQVIPPGTDLDRFYPAGPGALERNELIDEIHRFLRDPEKPWILTVARPDRRKNLPGLVEAFARSDSLRRKANLVIVSGNRDCIDKLPDNEREVFTKLLMLQDDYDLYGSMALPKTHTSETDIPAIYRYVAARHGVFVNSAFIELFGLTAIESAACGLPFVAPDSGGPVDIVANCECGVTVDTTDPEQLARAIEELLDDKQQWAQLARAGRTQVGEVYSWQSHVDRYVELLLKLRKSGRFPRQGKTGINSSAVA